MKKRFLLAAGLFTLFAVTSCSSKDDETTVDNTDLYTDIAKEWALNGGYDDKGSADVDLVYGDDIINTKKDEDVSGAHITLSLPLADSYDDLIRTHQVNLSKNNTRSGEVSTTYGVMNSTILTFKSSIENGISDKVVNEISSKISIFEAEVQSSYSKTYEIDEKKEGQVVYSAYIPALFRYYSDTTTLSIVSFVFIPVKTVVGYSDELGTNSFVNSTADKEINWTVDSSNVIVDIDKE